jgi:tryptophan synthase beta chain
VRGGRSLTEVLPDATGHFGPYGGRFVPEALVAALDELDAAYRSAMADPAFTARLAALQRRDGQRLLLIEKRRPEMHKRQAGG